MSEVEKQVNREGSAGIVRPLHWRFAEPPNELELRSGVKLGPVDVAYETYGEPDEDRNNAVLICHALSGDAHVAGWHSASDRKPGWWDIMVGPGKPIDTDRYYVICSNCLGGCTGTTGPGSINPKTGEPYGLAFPMVTIADMVRVQHALVRECLGLDRLLAVVGGSTGGMQVLQWAIDHPEMVVSAVPVATTTQLSAQAIAFNEVGRQAIYADPDWNDGQYYGGKPPARGLAVARMVGHITYLSERSMHEKFGRRLQDREAVGYDFGPPDFQVESYLRYKGDRFVERFDADTYLYMTKAMDYFDLAGDYGSLMEAFRGVKSRFLVVSYTGDWLFPTWQSKCFVRALNACGVTTTFCEVESDYGHDAFLLEGPELARMLRDFLANALDRLRKGGHASFDGGRE